MPLPVLRVQLLGGFNLLFDEAALAGAFPARLQSLLACLILHANVPQSRQHLAFLLWPDTGESQARNNLRQFLFQLRRVLPDAPRFLVTDANSITWKTDEQQHIDLHRFERAEAAAETAERNGDEENAAHWLQEAVSAYQGDLLPGCYDEWIMPERERLREVCRNACYRLVRLREAQRAYAAALPVAQQLLRLDPLDEEAYITLMRLHALSNDRATTRRIYQAGLETVQREFGAEAGSALRAAYGRLQQVTPAPTFGHVDEGKGSYTLVGRKEEWRQLQAAWQQAATGTAMLVLISGEAGIGKSRLAEELFKWTLSRGVTTARTRCYGAEGRLSLAPVTEWLRNDGLRAHLASLDPIWLTEIARLLPELLSVQPPLDPPEPITEYGRRQRFFEALARGVLAAPSPILLWIDDLHWCDQDTLEWLHFLLRFAPRAPLLILGTARSEESPPDHPLSALVRQLRAEDKIAGIELAALDAAETARLASEVQGYGLDDWTIVRLYRETEGNPLFVVEAVRAHLDQAEHFPADAATRSSPLSLITPRVQAIIARRLALLSPQARKVAEVAAVVGRAFTLDLLILGMHEDEEIIIGALDELWQRRIAREQSPGLFDFTHDRLRDVAYAATSVPQRRMFHRRIAQALEALYAADLDPVSPHIAAHYEQAGLAEQALPFYQRAAAVAAAVYANEEAITLYRHCLVLLGQLPPSIKRDGQELEVQLALATLYRISRGWASPEEQEVMSRAMVLSEKVGTVEQRTRTLFGLQTLYVVQAQYEKVERTYKQMEKLFWETQGTLPPPFAAINLAGARLFMGDFVEARAIFEKVVAVRDDKRIRDLQESQGLNYLVHGLAWNAHVLWCLGYPQRALDTAQTAVASARGFSQPFSQALAITYLAMLQAWCADLSTSRARADEACALTEACKAPYYLAWATILQRFAMAEEAPEASNLDALRMAIQRFTTTGAHVRLPIYYTLLGRACLTARRWEEGLEALELALAEALQNNEHWWDAEIYRLRGELLWAQGADLDDVAAAFQRALKIAASQQARSLSLRAAISLVRLWQGQGDAGASEARKLLASLYASFTEGFDTPDLRTAHALLTDPQPHVSPKTPRR